MHILLRSALLSLTLLAGIVAAASAQSLGPPPGGVADGPSPKPPPAPGSIGMPAPQSPATRDALRQAALDGYKRMFPSMSEAEAGERLDLQAKVPDFYGRLLGSLGRSISQTWFDSAAGRIVVVLSPTGDEQKAREVLAGDFGLATSEVEIKRGALDYRELRALVDQTSRRLRSMAPGHVSVGVTTSPGVEVLVAKDTTAEEWALIDEVAKTPAVFVTRSTHNDLIVDATSSACGSVWAGIWDRYCDYLRGGSRYSLYNGARCSLGWWAGFVNDPSYSGYLLTAGHCLTEPMGRSWSSCNWPITDCSPQGWEAARRYDYAGGDNGVVFVSTGRLREAGWTDWRNNGRHPINRTEFWPQSGWWMCHGGATQGFSCGVITARHPVDIRDPNTGVITTISDMIDSDTAGYPCIRGGDSGGPVFTEDGDGAIGTVSAGSCGEDGFYRFVAEPLQRAYATYGILPYGG